MLNIFSVMSHSRLMLNSYVEAKVGYVCSVMLVESLVNVSFKYPQRGVKIRARH